MRRLRRQNLRHLTYLIINLLIFRLNIFLLGVRVNAKKKPLKLEHEFHEIINISQVSLNTHNLCK